MTIFDQEVMDVGVHGESAGSFVVVPTEIDAGEFGPFPIFSDFVIFFEHGGEVFSMFPAHIFDAKIVNDKAKHDGPPLVPP